MKQIILFTFAFLFITSPMLADEFIVKSFNTINNKILTNSQKVYDDNDELCAIILVRTSLTKLGISASTPIVGSPKRIEGDYRVHLSAGTRMIKFFKDGFSTSEYVFPEKIEKGNFYIVELEYRRTDVTVTGNTMGFVLINSDPQGADVYINDEATGLQTPFQNPYNEGYYNYSLKMSQYLIYTGEFTITPNKTQKLDVNLTPDFGSLNLTFFPKNEATILIDGVKIEKSSPASFKKLSLGEHTLSISAFLYEPYEQKFTINREQTTSLNINLVPNFGSLELNITPPTSVVVSIGGIQSTQNSPYKILQLTPGTHTLSVSKSKYISYQQDITIIKGENIIVNIDLQPNFGDLFISTTPEVNAKVIIDNVEYTEKTPLVLNEFTAGKHSLRLVKSMYLTHEQEFVIEKGMPKTLEIALAPTFGMVEITTNLNADIYIDNQKMGRGSYNGRLLKGSHIIDIKKELYISRSKQIDINVGETYTELFTLVPKIGTLSIMTTPVEADIYIDNELQGQSPKFINNIIIGTYTLKLQKQGFATTEKQIEITENATTTINETLPSAAEVRITSSPASAKLYIDGKYMGITPQTLSLNYKNYNFRIEKDGYEDFETTKSIAINDNNYRFQLEEVLAEYVLEEEEFDDTEIFSVVESMPEFQGGMNKLMGYLGANIVYPLLAKESGIQGRVFINFVIETDGSISNIRVLRGIGAGCDEEAVRVVKAMPKWKPGSQRGEPVRVSYNLPIKFTLN